MQANDDHPFEPNARLEFGHEVTAPRARDAIRPLLREDGTFADAVSVVASQMVSNVVQHTEYGGRLKAWDDDPLLVITEDNDSTVLARAERPRFRHHRHTFRRMRYRANDRGGGT